MYKLIAIDLDGTLLNSYGQISKKNKEAIKKAIEKKVEVVLTSGRGGASVENLANEIGANHYMICGNGAMIYDLQKNELMYNNFLSQKKVLQLIEICEENSIYYSIYTQDSIITKNLNYNVLFYHQENANKPDNKKTNIYIVQDIYEYVLNRKEDDYIKVNICDDNNIIFQSIIKKLRKVKGIDVLDVGHMSRKIIKSGTEEFSIEYFYTEISSQNVDKWTAIDYLIKQINIKKEEVIAIGDNINDKTMLENAGLGVAMANSAPYIQKMAKMVTDSNNEDGVAKVIEEQILEK
ncbi:MAG: HAD family phosphatase [Clostridia bacterium]|nr:HAD family phosphatase [Clostridia bacterium]